QVATSPPNNGANESNLDNSTDQLDQSMDQSGDSSATAAPVEERNPLACLMVACSELPPFESKQLLDDHYEQDHEIAFKTVEGKPKFLCLKCSKTLVNSINFQTHLAHIHNVFINIKPKGKKKEKKKQKDPWEEEEDADPNRKFKCL